MGEKRWIAAPGNDGPMSTGQLAGVWVEENEYVRWTWTHNADGTSAVTGYEIVRIDDELNDCA
jgi:hypothetical protein